MIRLFSLFVCFPRHSSTLAPPHTLKTGEILRQMRIYTDEDVIEYAKVSRDMNPLHFDSEAARKAGFGRPLVHGMLVGALFPWIIASHFPGAVYVSQSLRFKAPVYVGEEMMGEVEAVSIRESKKGYLAKFLTRCFRNADCMVLEGEAMAILPTLQLLHAS